MKKKHVQLGKKLILGKETISNLDNGEQGGVLGGAPNTLQFSCWANCPTKKDSCLSDCLTYCVVCNTFGPTCPTDSTPAICH